MTRKKLMVLILSSVPFLMVLGNSMLIPEFPTIRAHLNITQFQVGLLVTFFSAPAAAAIPFLGYLSDMVGRKIIIIPCIILYGGGGLISGLAAAFSKAPLFLILAGRAIQGIGAAGTAPIAMALAGDMFPTGERSESMGILEAANGLGKVLSPIIGAAVALLVWYALFFSYAILSIPIALFIWFFVKEPENKTAKIPLKQYMASIISIFRKKGVSLIFNFGGGLIILFILFGVLSFTSDMLGATFNFSGLYRGMILSIPLLTMSVTAYLTGLHLKKRGTGFKISFSLGLIVVSIAMGILPLCCRSVIIYPILLGLLGFGSGLVLPAVNTMVTSASQREQRGGITSLYGSVRFIGVALGPPVFSLLQDIGVSLMFLSGGGLALIWSILGVLFINEERIMKQTN